MNTKMKVDQFISQHAHFYYCEIVILPDGYVMEGIPSHTEALIGLWCDKNSKTREELKSILIESSESPLCYLCNDLQCVAVWYSNICIPPSGMNPIQIDTLQRLVTAKCVDEIVLNMIP